MIGIASVEVRNMARNFLSLIPYWFVRFLRFRGSTEGRFVHGLLPIKGRTVSADSGPAISAFGRSSSHRAQGRSCRECFSARASWWWPGPVGTGKTTLLHTALQILTEKSEGRGRLVSAFPREPDLSARRAPGSSARRVRDHLHRHQQATAARGAPPDAFPDATAGRHRGPVDRRGPPDERGVARGDSPPGQYRHLPGKALADRSLRAAGAIRGPSAARNCRRCSRESPAPACCAP